MPNLAPAHNTKASLMGLTSWGHRHFRLERCLSFHLTPVGSVDCTGFGNRVASYFTSLRISFLIYKMGMKALF